MQVTKYTLVFVYPISKKFISFCIFFSYCIQCFQVQVYIADIKCTEHLVFLAYSLIDTVLRKIKCTVYTLLKNLHLASLSQKMYVTYNNKGIDAYLYTTKSELIYNLFMHQISLYILYEQNSAYLFLVFNFFLYILHILLPKPKCKYTLCS